MSRLDAVRRWLRLVLRARVVFFWMAVVAIALVVLVEIGSLLWPRGHEIAEGVLTRTNEVADQSAAATDQVELDPPGAGEFDLEAPDGDEVTFTLPGDGEITEPPGRAIPYLALVDGILLFTVGLMAAGLLLPHRLHGRAQGVATLVAAITLIIISIILLLLAIVELVVMVTLLFAFPFGTIAYLIIWGSFARGDAALLLSLLMFLKLVFAAAMLAFQQRMIQNKGLVLMVLTSLVCNLVAAFLHGLVPEFLVAILDEVGAIIFAVVAIIWAIVLLVGSIPAIVKAARTTTTTPGSAARRLVAWLLRTVQQGLLQLFPTRAGRRWSLGAAPRPASRPPPVRR